MIQIRPSRPCYCLPSERARGRIMRTGESGQHFRNESKAIFPLESEFVCHVKCIEKEMVPTLKTCEENQGPK